MKLLLLFTLCLIAINSLQHVNSFQQLGTYHCTIFPIDILYRLSSGSLAQKYGIQYAELDCYIRQFINLDGQDLAEGSVQDQSSSLNQQSDDDQENQEQQQQQLPEIDPILLQYSKGIQGCLPKNTNSTEAVYQIWRFIRFMVQHDYAYEWIRAKVRSTIGYQSERPSSWMDGQPQGERIRLQKLYSNQFYQYLDGLMFKQFLHPIMTFLRKNVILAMDGHLTESGRPLLLQYIETKNIVQQVFFPIKMRLNNGVEIFSYTIPGIPLLMAGATEKISWGFSGVLVDRSNIEQIQTLKNKFYHYNTETWIKLDSANIPIAVAGQQQNYKCTYMHSNYGTLFEKHDDSGKVSQYITRWHQKEKKVRVLFSQLVDWIGSGGALSLNMQFPFNSLLAANTTGIYHYICYQYHPSYFLYADLASQAEHHHARWIKNPKKHYFVVANTHLTTTKPQSYLKKQVQNSKEEQIIELIKQLSDDKPSAQQWFQSILTISTDPLTRFRKDLLIMLYRKVKFLFFPDEMIRKECDQLIAAIQSWNNDYNSPKMTPAYILWQYYVRQYSYNYISKSNLGRDIVRHKALTEKYWTSQMKYWQSGTSFGECDNDYWKYWTEKLNGTGHNSTCYLNIMRAINKTREVLRMDNGQGFYTMLEDFKQTKIINISEQFKGNDIDQAFGNYFSKNLAFVSEVGSTKISYLQGYNEKKEYVILSGQQESQNNNQSYDELSEQL